MTADERTGGLRGGVGTGLRVGLRDVFSGEHACHGDATGTGLGQLAGQRLGPAEARKQRIAGRNRWIGGSLVGLIFLVYAMVQAAFSGGSVGPIITFEVLALAFGVLYVLAPIAFDGFDQRGGHVLRKCGVLALMVALTIPMIAVGGTGVTGLWIYVAVAASIVFPLRGSLTIALVLASAMLITVGLGGDSLPWELALTLVALSLWMSGFANNIRLTVELRATRDELAHAAVAAERERIGRDLHDILGHSLTAIAVKAGLARRLIDRDPDAAATEVADIETLTRDALADVRATAAGYRDVSLAGELAVAQSVLKAAGIAASMPTAVDSVTAAGREVFGYVVREAVTNVVRHSGASRCIIELTPTGVQVIDYGYDPGRVRARGETDHTLGGPPAAEDATPGHGLDGLAERLASVGGTLRAGPRSAGGFRVTATVPATVPAPSDSRDEHLARVTPLPGDVA